MSEHELKPCPFCGGEAELDQMDDDGSLSALKWTVVCLEHTCNGYHQRYRHDRKAGAIEAWNRRALTAGASGGGDGWLPIDSAPRDGTPIALANADSGVCTNSHFAQWTSRSRAPLWVLWPYAHGNPTHWRPLPVKERDQS